mgnify:FL=1
MRFTDHKSNAAASRRSFAKLMADPERHEQRNAHRRAYYARSPVIRTHNRVWAHRWRQQNLVWARFCSRLRRYHLTLDQYHAKLESQDFMCGLCQTAEPQVIDHNHKTGKVRGLLCRQCNQALGLLKESPQLLSAAKEYVEAH